MSCMHNIVFAFKDKKGESDLSSIQVSESDDQNMERQTEKCHEEDLQILNDGDQVR